MQAWAEETVIAAPVKQISRSSVTSVNISRQTSSGSTGKANLVDKLDDLPELSSEEAGRILAWRTRVLTRAEAETILRTTCAAVLH